MIGEREFELMRSSAYFINTARGAIVDQKALTAALESGAVAGAALDVLEQEPPDPDEPIVRLPNVISFPHIGTATEETRRAMRGNGGRQPDSGPHWRITARVRESGGAPRRVTTLLGAATLD